MIFYFMPLGFSLCDLTQPMLLLFMPNEGDSMRRRKWLTLDIISFGTSLPFFVLVAPSSSFHHKSPKFLASVTDPFRFQTRLIFYWINDQVIWGTIIVATLPLVPFFIYTFYTHYTTYTFIRRD